MAYFISINQVFSQNFQRILVQLTDLILRGMDIGFHTGMILADLQKVFDTLDYPVLLQKMECVGFKESLIKWFQLFLSNRKFFVTLGVFSDAGIITCCVPQECISGLLDLLIYKNDLPQALEKLGPTSMLRCPVYFIMIKGVEKI